MRLGAAPTRLPAADSDVALLAPPAPTPRAERAGAGIGGHRSRSAATVLAVSDALAAAVALVLVLAFGPWHTPLAALTLAVPWVTIVIVLEALGAHTGARHRVVPSASEDLGRAVFAVVLATLALLSLDSLAGTALQAHLPPAEVLIGSLAVFALLPVARFAGLAAAARLGVRPVRVLVVGTGTIAADVARRVQRARLAQFVGFVDDQPTAGQPVLGPLWRLVSICRREAVDRVVVAFSRAHPSGVAATLRQLDDSVTIAVVSRYFDITGWEARLADLGGLPTVSLGGTRPGPAARALKRTVDVAGAATGLVLLLPVLAAVAVGVRLSSPGPVLFRQRRLGRRKRPFEIVKFRTMDQEGAEQEGAGLDQDGAKHNGAKHNGLGRDGPRVTRFGHLLRRSGIDELPQLINVLKGEMSLVGPRPFVLEECEGLPPWAEQRFDMRPGITGIWQVCGQHELRMDELYRLDAQYARSWSLLSDLRILAKTPGRLLNGGGDRAAFRDAHEDRVDSALGARSGSRAGQRSSQEPSAGKQAAREGGERLACREPAIAMDGEASLGDGLA